MGWNGILKPRCLDNLLVEKLNIEIFAVPIDIHVVFQASSN